MEKILKRLKKFQFRSIPIDAKEVIKGVGVDNSTVGHDSAKIGIQILYTGFRWEVQTKVEKVGGEEMVKLLEVSPGSVNKTLLRHVLLCLE